MRDACVHIPEVARAAATSGVIGSPATSCARACAVGNAHAPRCGIGQRETT